MGDPSVTISPQEYVTLRDYVDTRLEAIDTSLGKAERSLNERLATMNEFREALRDQSGKFATRENVDFARDRLEKDMGALALRVAELEKAQANSMGRQAMLLTGVTIFLTVLSLVLKFVV